MLKAQIHLLHLNLLEHMMGSSSSKCETNRKHSATLRDRIVEDVFLRSGVKLQREDATRLESRCTNNRKTATIHK